MFAAPITPGDPKVMRISDLINLITSSGVCGENLGDREIGVIFNLSMQQGYFPTKFKTAKIIPIYKKKVLAKTR